MADESYDPHARMHESFPRVDSGFDDDNVRIQLGKSFLTTRDPQSFPVRQATPDEMKNTILPRIK